MEVTDVAGAVLAIHNVPGEGDVGAVLGGLEVANNLEVVGAVLVGYLEFVRTSLKRFFMYPCSTK